ncbi:MAG: hypothetical protein E4G90_11815 [Gemmatimonadales bacterium]|nr:MAG: hypothetical protein E4G90_11815 [Gemmatimonadales bacterium]
MKARNALFAVAMSVAMLACTEYGTKVCDYCEQNNPLKACQYGLECVDYMCVRPGGNLPGECGDQGAAEGGDDTYCVYQTCAASPIHPPLKEDLETLSDPFAFHPDTRVILPEDPAPTDQTAGDILQAQIKESHGVQLAVQAYTAGISLENAIVLGTEASNPGVQTLVSQLGLAVPGEGPSPGENYAFEITGNQILVAGLGDAGVLHGSQALKQLIRGEAVKSPSAPLESRVVKDYPDVERRTFTLLLMFYHVPPDNDGDGEQDPYKYTHVPVDLDIARAYLHHLSEFRYNTVLFSLADIVTWASLPQPQNTAISVSELMDLVTEANVYGLEVIPFLTGSSSSHGWIGTEDHPVEYTAEYSLANDEANLAIYKDVLQEIVSEFALVQPLQYFHIGMDEDLAFGPRSGDMHRQWVNEAYGLLTSNNVRMMIWHDTWTLTPDYLYNYANYPDMHVGVWHYSTFIPDDIYTKINDIVSKGMEVSQAILENGRTPDFERWFSNPSPLKQGFTGLFWIQTGTTCKQQSFDYLIPRNIRTDAQKFWNARTY